MTMTVLTVGAGEEYATIAAAVAAASSGDTIDVNAGTYVVGDLKISRDLTFAAVGGTVDIVAPPTVDRVNVAKGLFIIGTDTSTPNVTIEGFSFSGAKSAQSNGAGIRYQSGNLTLQNDSFSNNQDGILAPPFVSGTGTIDVNDCVFDHNGAGDGQSHNIYIGYINTFVMTNSISEDAVVGHEVKSRAENNTIEDNQIIDGPTGTASYSIDLPNGGNDIIQGNTIEKGPDASAPIAIHVGGPMLPYPDSNVLIQDNTFINNDGPAAVVVNNEFTTPVTLTDNTIEGFTNILQGIGTQSGNVNGSEATIAASIGTTPPDSPSATINLGNTPGNQTVTMTKPGYLVVGGSGLLTVVEDTELETVYGGSGGVAISGDGGQTDYTKAGSTNTITANGNGNTFFSFGNDTITVSGYNSNYDIYGTAHVNGSLDGTADSESSYVSGTEDFNMRGAYENFTMFPGGTANISGTGSVDCSENDATVNFDYTNSKVSSLSGGSVTTTTFSGSLIGGRIDMGNGNMTVYENTTRATIDLVQGTYIISDAGSMISGGSATVSISEYAGKSLTFIGGSGSATLLTDSGGATIFVGSGLLQADEHATDGAITYNFNESIGGGTVTIQDFRPTEDTFVYTGFAGNPIESQKVSGGSLYVTLQNHTTIDLLHETKL
jgi:hypothetical protein